MDPNARRWRIVNPLKPLPHGKSRLAVSADLRQALSLAMALDTIASVSASQAVGQVYVVSPDSTVQQQLGETVHVLAREPAGGLNAAFGYGPAPRAWAGDPSRCAAAKAPAEMEFATKPQLGVGGSSRKH